MKLHQLKRSAGLKDKANQRWRWDASGRGNFSGRWMKWQNSRSGGGVPVHFEWGQTPIVKRMPKLKGFKRPFKLVKDIAVINLWTLDQDTRIDDSMEVSKQVLKDLWYIKNTSIIVKILGDGDYSKKLKFVDIELFSKSAKEKMDKPGSTKTGKVKLKAIKDTKAPTKTVKKASVKKPAAKKPAVKKETVKKAVVKKPAKKIEEKPLLDA